MKLEKTASGSNKVTISKAEWLHIGKQAGWSDQDGVLVEEKPEVSANPGNFDLIFKIVKDTDRYMDDLVVDLRESMKKSRFPIDSQMAYEALCRATKKLLNAAKLEPRVTPEMLGILSGNIREWFGKKFPDRSGVTFEKLPDRRVYYQENKSASSGKAIKTAEFDGLSNGQTGIWQDQFSRLLQDLTSEHEQLRHLTNYEERFDRVKQMIALANKALQSLEKHKQDIWKQIEPTWRPIPANIKLNNP